MALRAGRFSLVLLAAGGATGVASAAESDLPPVECVRLLREARVAHLGHLADPSADTSSELRALRAAHETFPDEIAPTYALLEFDRRHGLPEEERTRLETRFRGRLGDPEDPLPLPLLRWMARDPDREDALAAEIAASLEKRLERASDDEEELLSLLADLQHRLGREDEAVVTLERLWELTEADDVAWRLFWLELRLERWSEALEVMEAVDDLREHHWPTHVHVLIRAGRPEEALAVLERHDGDAAGASPITEATASGAEADLNAFAQDARVSRWVALAWSFRDAGRDAEAETLFRRALALDPDSSEIAAVLLHLYASEDERQEYAAAVSEGWETEADPQKLLDEGTQRLAAGDAEGALELLARAAPHFPRLEAPWFNVGMAAYQLERWSQAAEALGRAVELNPERAAAHFFRGVALMHLERCGEAVEALERGLELDPERTSSHYYLTQCYRVLGQAEAAERHRRLYEASRDL